MDYPEGKERPDLQDFLEFQETPPGGALDFLDQKEVKGILDFLGWAVVRVSQVFLERKASFLEWILFFVLLELPVSQFLLHCWILNSNLAVAAAHFFVLLAHELTSQENYET